MSKTVTLLLEGEIKERFEAVKRDIGVDENTNVLRILISMAYSKLKQRNLK